MSLTLEQIRTAFREEMGAVRSPAFTDTIGAAKYCDSTPQMFLTMRKEKRGPPWHKVTHRLVRYKYSELDTWMAYYKIDPEESYR